MSLRKWMFWSSSKPLVSAKMKGQRPRPHEGLPGCRMHGQVPLRPPPLPLPGLTFLTGGLVGGIGAVGSVITLQEAVNATAVAAAELGGVTGARAHWVGRDGIKSEVRLEHRPPSTKSPPSTWPSLPQHSIMTCPLLPF